MNTFGEKQLRDLLIANLLSESDIHRLLEPVGFEDFSAAHRALLRISILEGDLGHLAQILPSLLIRLSEAAEPDRILINIERFIASNRDPGELIKYLKDQPKSLEMLITLVEASQFLTEILLRNPDYFELLSEHHQLSKTKLSDEFCGDALDAISGLGAGIEIGFTESLNALRQYQRWELLRIGVCDLLDLFDLRTVTIQLSALASGLIEACLKLAQHATDAPEDGFTVIALGKLGGVELNYSSDIDLIFICAEEPTSFEVLGKKLIHALTDITHEGFLYRVDMRLRPWGSTGALVSSLDGYSNYLESSAKPWEHQALIKARCAAGDQVLGQRFLSSIKPCVYAKRESEHRSYIYQLKNRTEEYLRNKSKDAEHVKLGEGSIRDIEFLTQALQLEHGQSNQELQRSNTLEALIELNNLQLITTNEHRTLAGGYTFLRILEHQLQLMHHQQTHSLPSGDIERQKLAKRLGYMGDDANQSMSKAFRDQAKAIRAIYERYLGESTFDHDALFSQQAGFVEKHIARLAPTYAEVFDNEEIEHHAKLVSRLSKENLVELEIKEIQSNQWKISIISYNYFGELSLICGLLFAHGLDILEGQVFTYQERSVSDSAQKKGSKRKIVDVFLVQSDAASSSSFDWDRFTNELNQLIFELENRNFEEAKSRLLKQIAIKFTDSKKAINTLAAVDIHIDNDHSKRYTALHITATNTNGFLYELANALSFFHVNIVWVDVQTIGQQVEDTIHVQGANGKKITSSMHLQELTTATALVKHFTHILPHAPDPEMAMTHFREFMGDLFERSNWTEELVSIEQPQVIKALSQVLGGSDFLWHDFLRTQYDNLFPLFRNLDMLKHQKDSKMFDKEVCQMLDNADDKGTQLSYYKESELARIDLRYILGYVTDIREFSEELTALAEVIITYAFDICLNSLKEDFGVPMLENGIECPVSILALGKCGGKELGFASDLELMFIYEANGKTSGPRITSSAEFFEKLVQELLIIMKTKQKGTFEVDLQLRPFGKSGDVAVSLESFKNYFGNEGAAWPYERQSLIRLRSIGGDQGLGRIIHALRDEYVYSGNLFDVTAMRAMRERQIRHMVKPNIFNAKLSTGGLVDIEYLVQGLQITHGDKISKLRVSNTLLATTELTKSGIMTKVDQAVLEEAYLFFGKLINALRMVRGNAEDLNVPEPRSHEFGILARRLGYMDTGPKFFHDDIEYFAEKVREINARYLP
jgi:glutamate-ammonia-ligase adenylyltransferase